MPSIQDFTLQRATKNGNFVYVTKSYEIDSLKELAKVLLNKKSLHLQIVDVSGAVLWQGKSNPNNEVARNIDK